MLRKMCSPLSILLVFVIVLLSSGFKTREISPDKERDSEIQYLLESLECQLESDRLTDEMIMEELKSKEYSATEPLVILDPYHQAPLSALVLFTTEEPVQTEVYLKGRSRQADIHFAIEEFKTEHIIPIYGLYPDTDNVVKLSVKNEVGQTTRTMVNIQTEALTESLNSENIITYNLQPEAYSGGFNFVTNLIGRDFYGFDINGDYRWYLTSQLGTVAYAAQFADRSSCLVQLYSGEDSYESLLVEISLTGKILNAWYVPYAIHHDIEQMENGNFLILASNEESQTIILEMEYKTGKITTIRDLSTVLQLDRVAASYADQLEWFHANKITAYEGNVIISGRHQSAVVKLSWPDFKLDWVIAQPTGWEQRFTPFLLTPKTDDFEWNYGQHAAKVLPDLDNDEDTVDILMFDNGNDRLLHTPSALSVDKNYSRLLHLRVNEKKDTIETVWEFGKERKELYTKQWGDAQYLENGNYLGTFIPSSANGAATSEYSYNVYIELSNRSEIIWETHINPQRELLNPGYGLKRLPFYRGDCQELGIGAEPGIYIPEQ